MRDIRSSYHFSEMLRPLTRRQVQSIVRLGDGLKKKGSWGRFALSNLGSIAINSSAAPFWVNDLRLYMHSLNFRALCLVTYTFEGEMRFYCVGDEKCMSPGEMEMVQRELMTLLSKSARPSVVSDEMPGVPAPVAG